MNKYVTEFLGTFFLVLTIALTGNPLAIGAILMVMVYMGGNISGGHYNPAVTLGVFVRGKINMRDTFTYWVSQLLGAFVAVWACSWLIGKTFYVAPAADVDFLRATTAEFIFTFALVSVVLNVTTVKKAAGNSYFGLAIGATVMAGAIAVGPISGGAFNPAVALSPAIFNAFQGGNALQFAPIYLTGCLLGGVVAGLLFKIMNPEENTTHITQINNPALQNSVAN